MNWWLGQATNITFQTYPTSGKATNVWNYDAYTGFLTHKLFQGGNGTHHYTYDNASRLSTASSGNYSATYGYLAKSPWVSSITYKAWDAENRITRMETLSSVPNAAKYRLDFTYDFMGRRTKKLVSTWNTLLSNWMLSSERRYVYDGWNLIAELDDLNLGVRTFLWGTDLSGSIHGAGGVGGLLAISTKTSPVETHFVGSDALGNVTCTVKGNDGTLSTQFEYGPFGEAIRRPQKGTSYAALNPFQFSTKFTDEESDLVYYGYRYYDPIGGRWLSRDPIGERGGKNLYGFLSNNSINSYDLLGLDNPITTGPGGVTYPSDPYMPGGSLYVPPGTSPSVLDQILGGPDSLEVNQTRWFEQNYPGWTAFAREFFTEKINSRVRRNCRDRYMLEPRRLPVYPYYSGMGMSSSGASSSGSISGRSGESGGEDSETRFGDKPQSRFSADKVLGAFVFKIDDTVNVRYSETSLKCCKEFHWEADVVVYDVVGFQPGDPGHYVSFGANPTRGLIRARWKISGKGLCCDF